MPARNVSIHFLVRLTTWSSVLLVMPQTLKNGASLSSLLALLFKSDLCKLIDEIDSMDRSSVVSANFMSKSQLYNLGNNDSATFDNENDLSNRRKSIDNISIDAFNSSRSKQKQPGSWSILQRPWATCLQSTQSYRHVQLTWLVSACPLLISTLI